MNDLISIERIYYAIGYIEGCIEHLKQGYLTQAEVARLEKIKAMLLGEENGNE